MFVLSAIFAFLTPVFSNTRFIYIWVISSAYIGSLINIKERFSTDLTKHVTLCNQLGSVWRWVLIFWNLNSLELMRMLSILLIALVTKGEIITGHTIKPIASPLDWMITFITCEPSFKPLILFMLLHLLLH